MCRSYLGNIHRSHHGRCAHCYATNEPECNKQYPGGCGTATNGRKEIKNGDSLQYPFSSITLCGRTCNKRTQYRSDEAGCNCESLPKATQVPKLLDGFFCSRNDGGFKSKQKSTKRSDHRNTYGISSHVSWFITKFILSIPIHE